MAFYYLTSQDIQEICHRLAVLFLERHGEPISPFESVNSHLLESALGRPSQSFGQDDFYPSLEEKAAALFHSLIQNHPFPNGNKRVATVSMLVFIHVHGYWVNATSDEIYELAISVARGEHSNLKEITDWLKPKLILSKPRESNPSIVERFLHLFKK